jgi:hypothetical protein
MGIDELMSAKEAYFQMNNLIDDNSRKRKLVYARGAFAVAFRCVAGPSLMGKVLGRDHASVVHYTSMHSSLMEYDDYKDFYEKAISFRESLFKREDLPKLSHADLMIIIKKLRQELREEKEKTEELYIYKEKFFKLKELI